MSTLHIVNKASRATALAACLRVASSGDSILLIEDGTYLMATLQLGDLPSAISCYALQADAQARGLSMPASGANIAMVDDSAFVELVCKHTRSLSWF